MGILDFFEQNVGKWFSQRTSYQLGQTEQWHQSDKTNLFNELLPADADDVVQLCDRCRVSPHFAIAGLRTRWEKTYSKPAGSTLLVALSRESSNDRYILLRGGNGTPTIQGTYYWGSDRTLVIVTEVSGCKTEERLWFSSENLRLRTSLMEFEKTEMNVSSFYSEIRMGAVPAPAAE